MDGRPEIDALARRFLDLWQQQAVMAAADPLLAEALARWLAVIDNTVGAAAGMAAGRSAEGMPHHDRSAAPAGAPASAAASVQRDHDLAELARRLAECEARLARLEAAAAGGGKRPRRRARRRPAE
jgi:hypothetical protein